MSSILSLNTPANPEQLCKGVLDLHRDELLKTGWTEIEGIHSRDSFLDLASAIGTIRKNPNGECIKSLRPTSTIDAKPNTFSSRFGRGAFPYHTDGAYFALPPRYILLRACEGDLRRPTYLKAFEAFFTNIFPARTAVVRDSIWMLNAGSRACYVGMQFKTPMGAGFRYDPQCMRPANQYAALVSAGFAQTMTANDEAKIDWNAGKVAIVDNWIIMHARGPEPENEGERVLERIYADYK